MSLRHTHAARVALAIAVSFACAQASAESGPEATVTDLDQIVVTATRTPQSLADTLASTTVIDRERIDRLQPASLPELLRGTPGLTFANNGGNGKITTMSLRGAGGSQVLVLVDGVRIGSASAGLAAFQDIPVDQIERIEIVRGPFSSLYGSEALGGVIQIFTRRPEGAFAPHASVALGSFDTRRASAGVAGKQGDGWYSINAAHERTEGIDACRGSGTLFAGCFTDEPDKDGYENNSLSLQGGYRFGDAWDAEARVFRAEGQNDYDGSFANQADVVQQVAGARLRYAPSEKIAVTFNAGRSVDESDDFKDGEFSSRFDTHRDLASLQADIGAGTGLVSFGFDWQRDAVDSDAEFDETQRINRGVFGQWQGDFGRQSFQASLRRDDNSQFGGETTGSARYGFSFTEDLKLVASYGTAYRAPTFNDLYFHGFSNPDLSPETSRTFELGLRGTHATGNWSISAYQTRAEDLITFDAVTFLPANVDRAFIRGAEATLDFDIAGWTVLGTATWLDPRNDSGGFNRDNFLPRRARQSGRVDADRSFGAFSFGASVYAEGERYDDLANRTRLPGYSLVDLRVGYALSSDWSIQLNAANVFDREYETAAWFNQPGRSYTLSLRFQPRQ
ncbi:TonB-dependent vitamin B12 receptor [Luteimonas sp. SX5]|uniref:TonB-dependent vitamin B12 receptor n=1 Tax=Luteimonas galliterrae TaxID=2940486 RepID=A0ABT0MI43_9GAMM|nr:TonB-dependent vitamin B12 receptor [Luteimonas galliterrae]MCL1634530.1 TonB-dependent vitamin B12 receptor [Luteimonas galliterrae]